MTTENRSLTEVLADFPGLPPLTLKGFFRAIAVLMTLGAIIGILCALYLVWNWSLDYLGLTGGDVSCIIIGGVFFLILWAFCSDASLGESK